MSWTVGEGAEGEQKPLAHEDGGVWAKAWTLAGPEKSPGTLQHRRPKTGMEQVARRAGEWTANVEALENGGREEQQ